MAALANTDIMYDSATYWAPSTPDGYGGGTFPAPIAITCRWEDTSELFIDSTGREAQSAAVVYPDQVVLTQGWLYQGTSTEADPHNVLGAFEIKNTRKIGSLDNVLYELKAWL